MLLLAVSPDREIGIQVLRRSGVKTLIEVNDWNSIRLMAYVASKLVPNPDRVVGLVASDRKGWGDFEKLAQECGHSSKVVAVIDPTRN